MKHETHNAVVTVLALGAVGLVLWYLYEKNKASVTTSIPSSIPPGTAPLPLTPGTIVSGYTPSLANLPGWTVIGPPIGLDDPLSAVQPCPVGAQLVADANGNPVCAMPPAPSGGVHIIGVTS